MSGEAACRRAGPEAFSEDVIVNADGTMRNVYVHIVSGLGTRVFAPPRAPAEMDQERCLFVPHVLAAQTGQVIVFKNSDTAVHNVRAIARANPTFNVSKAEVVRIKCDIHAWMGASIAVDDSPFHAITGDGGAFSLTGLPAGTYVVEAWHETLGTTRQTVSLADGGRGALEFSFGR